jgi:hypothetical protein
MEFIKVTLFPLLAQSVSGLKRPLLQNLCASLVFAFILPQAVFASPDVGTIVVNSKDARGRPLAGILVAVKAPNKFGRYATDTSGKVKFDSVSVGKWAIEIHCPSTTYVGREIQTAIVAVDVDTTKTLVVRVPIGYCDEPKYSERDVTITGNFSHGFEVNDFLPDNPDVLDLTKNTFADQASIWILNPPKAFRENKVYRITVRGTLMGPASFGHGNGSEYGFIIKEVLDYKRVRK